MNEHDISERFSTTGLRAQDAQDGRMAEIADRLRGSHSANGKECNRQELPTSKHGITLPEHIVAETLAMDMGIWFDDVSCLGEIGSCGDENYCYVDKAGSVVYKVNMLTHSGENILKVFEKVKIHNLLFPDTRYTFVGFTNMGYARSVFPIFSQPFIVGVANATMEQIAEYMEKLGYEHCEEKRGAWRNDSYLVWDLLPKNVLVDSEGYMYVIDAEFIELQP